MNVFDFDKTIYDGDSTMDFYWFCLKKQPSILRFFPRQALAFFRYGVKNITKTQMKQEFFRYYPAMQNMDALLESFWDTHQHKIKKWYLEMQQPGDIIISASPEFLLQPICTRLHIAHLQGSRVDPKTGKYTGQNCHGQEKVCRFEQVYGKQGIDAFYSDSLSDTPLALLAKESFLVKGNDLSPWPTD